MTLPNQLRRGASQAFPPASITRAERRALCLGPLLCPASLPRRVPPRATISCHVNSFPGAWRRALAMLLVSASASAGSGYLLLPSSFSSHFCVLSIFPCPATSVRYGMTNKGQGLVVLIVPANLSLPLSLWAWPSASLSPLDLDRLSHAASACMAVAIPVRRSDR